MQEVRGAWLLPNLRVLVSWEDATQDTPWDWGAQQRKFPLERAVPSCASIGMWDEADLELPLLFLLLWLLMEWWDCSLR